MKNQYIQPSTDMYSIEGVVMQAASILGSKIEGSSSTPIISSAPTRDFHPGLE